MAKNFLLFLMLSMLLACEPPNPNVVAVDGGLIEGKTNTTGDIQFFKGIPFAAPPVGDLRWKAPQPVKNWEGIRKCVAFGPSPMQAKPAPFMFWSSEFLIPEKPIGEDCLYLNVWKSAEKATAKRPVLVYIYGGGFRSGGTGCPIYDGEAMARKGIVFVSINYRVGVFGFLAHPELSREAEYRASGNYGLLDMIAGLRWVQNNIAAFGGDPDNITIAGQSAGAFGVNYLTASPLAKGLFHRAIAQSGGSFYARPNRPSTNLKEAEQQGIEFAESLNVGSLPELRALSAEEILQAEGGPSWPILDGYLLPKSIYTIYEEGQQNDVPILVGWNKDDRVSPPPVPAADFQKMIEDRFGEFTADFLAAYPNDNDKISARSQADMSRDETFGIQDYTWARMQTASGNAPSYVYNFDRQVPAHTPETAFGAFHSGEVVYAYDNLHTLDRPWEAIDQQIADVMSAYWVNFATHGNPNGEGLPLWEAYDPVEEKVMVIDEVIRSETLPAKKQLTFWENYFVSLNNK